MVASRDSSKDIHKDRLHVWVTADNLERGCHGFHVCSTTNIKKVCRRTTQQAKQVHCGHGKASTIDHARNIAVKLNVVQVEFLSLDLNRILLRQVPLVMDRFLPECGIVIEA